MKKAIKLRERAGSDGAAADTAGGLTKERDYLRHPADNLEVWGEIYELHFDRIFRYASGLLGDRAQAEEVTQETFVRALVARPEFRGDAALATWLNRIALNIAREHWRRNKNHTRLEPDVTAVTRSWLSRSGPEDAHLDRVRTQVLYSVLAQLPPKLREAFVLCDILQVERSQAARDIGTTAGNLAVRAHRARQHVREALEHLGWMEEM